MQNKLILTIRRQDNNFWNHSSVLISNQKNMTNGSLCRSLIFVPNFTMQNMHRALVDEPQASVKQVPRIKHKNMLTRTKPITANTFRSLSGTEKHPFQKYTYLKLIFYAAMSITISETISPCLSFNNEENDCE